MDEFRVCLNCGYTRGFHIAFRKKERGMELLFICPECGASWDLGFLEERLASLDPRREGTY